jgi:hypothetical protein
MLKCFVNLLLKQDKSLEAQSINLIEDFISKTDDAF